MIRKFKIYPKGLNFLWTTLKRFIRKFENLPNFQGKYGKYRQFDTRIRALWVRMQMGGFSADGRHMDASVDADFGF